METSSSSRQDDDQKQLVTAKKKLFRQQQSRFIQKKMATVLNSEKYSHLLKSSKPEDVLKEFQLWLSQKAKRHEETVSLASERALSYQSGTCYLNWATVQFLPNVPGALIPSNNVTVTGINNHTYSYGRNVPVSPESNYLHIWVYYRKIINGLAEIRLQHKIRLSPFMRIMFPPVALEYQDDFDENRNLSANGIPSVSAIVWHWKFQNSNDGDKICENNIILPWCALNTGSQSQGYYFPSLDSVKAYMNPLVDLGFNK